ncbi:hypothetical protein B9Z51_02305 [Limnohabitans sp. T6-5]|uniref:hypothetical protein n=1 Tax=Limnohabitans sp. T6-5 TaxID=1100724 RepID=UPI000D33CE46|nr:hypothetical protein [Limnohabitans sp. T6-5]PUE11169.1 hypothetical protein B9Z51_02305 [Limnohabitans sp. T6-5]
MSSKIKLALVYLGAIFASIVLLAAVQSLATGGPGGATIIGYVMVFGYFILRWKLVAGKIVIRDKWVSGLLRGFVLICAFVIFTGVSGFHGGSAEGKMFAAVIAVVLAIEAGRQVKRLSIFPSGQYRRNPANDKTARVE